MINRKWLTTLFLSPGEDYRTRWVQVCPGGGDVVSMVCTALGLDSQQD